MGFSPCLAAESDHFLKFFTMEADVKFWRELLQDDDSDNKQFEGLTIEEVTESELRCIKKDAETTRVIQELENGGGDANCSDLSDDSEEDEGVVSDLFKDAYDCAWLKKYEEEIRP